MNKLNPEYFPFSSVKFFLELKKDTINNTNETKNKGTIAEFPTMAGRTKKNKERRIVMNEKIEPKFFAILNNEFLYL